MISDEFTRNMTNIWAEDEWLTFELRSKKAKTNVFAVMSKCSNTELGTVKWYPQWRHYCFFPTIEEETMHSDRCLLSISTFITEINEFHKKQRVQE